MRSLFDAAVATGRAESLFADDWQARRADIEALVAGASVLVIGGSGTIGAACTRLILDLKPKRLHIIDVDENGLARVARDIRASGGDTADVELVFLAADLGAYPAAAHCAANAPFDLVLNFAAVKHVRSEKSLPALLHMIDTNVVKQRSFLRAIARQDRRLRYFAVSTDKAADPANFMGATKRILEEVIFSAGDRHEGLATSSARFANVAFSSGSLLESFVVRLQAGQPLAAPRDTRRFFISGQEAAEICLLALVSCPKGTLAIPRLSAERHLVNLPEIAAAFLARAGFRPTFVDSVAAAASMLSEPPRPGAAYPVVLTPRDTAGEKSAEVFVGKDEGVIELGLSNLLALQPRRVPADLLEATVDLLTERVTGKIGTRSIEELGSLVRQIVPNFAHVGGNAHLDDRI
ncbi:MAG: hypothetical protein QOK29_4263 [Rhodospirillaceae bacterium]|nr:hypothetical protein [Rhodospirillaceae bacterium]